MASTQPAPSSQSAGARPISFVLVDNSDPAGSILASNTLTLFVRPEDLTRGDTSRITVQQTLGGTAWMDNFGPGVPTININGHTGWRPPADPALGTADGVARFTQLKNQVFVNWHARRQVALQNGLNPDTTVQLQFADQLDSIAAVVAPMSFVLRRSRTRPLLYQYQISMVVMQDNIGQPTTTSSASSLSTNSSSALTTAQQQAAGVTSLTSSITTITSAAGAITAYVDASIVGPVAQFAAQTAAVLNAVITGFTSVAGLTGSLIATAQLTVACGLNIFRALASTAGLTNQGMGALMQIAGAYSNAVCILENVFPPGPTYPDYSSLYGSSNCSSTSGGTTPSIFAGLNPFQYTNPQQVPDAMVASTLAVAAMQTMAATDIVLSPPAMATIGSIASTAAVGISATA
jgi:hypothetical protein